MRNFTETREKAIKRTRQLVCYFAEFMLEEEEKGAKQRAEEGNDHRSYLFRVRT